MTQFATENSGGEHIHHVWEWTMKGMYVKIHLHMTKTDQNNQMRFTFLCLANGPLGMSSFVTFGILMLTHLGNEMEGAPRTLRVRGAKTWAWEQGIYHQVRTKASFTHNCHPMGHGRAKVME